MRFVLNAGIGDLIWCHAMLEPVASDRHTACLSMRAIRQARDERYLPFARRLLAMLFGGSGFDIAEEVDENGLDPLTLCWIGFRPRVPALAGVLPAGERPTSEPYVAVTTKVRGLERRRYEAIRIRLIEALRAISRRHPIVLIGEREIGRNAEYEHHGGAMVYSIYEDVRWLPCIDLTVPELGSTPPAWDQFRADCMTMRHARGVVALGSGGNVAMAISTGAPFGFLVGTEMAPFLSRVNGLPLHQTEEEFLAALEALA